ncbi:MAG: GspE/PulE family protein [Candidatus Pacebacteria bacterium]|nr:GspE/PulE family protein [Candidatus Paceibacterota bacterium]
MEKKRNKAAPKAQKKQSLIYAELVDEELRRESVSAARLLDLLVRHAHAVDASDIHLDPSRDGITARLRIHGSLQIAHLFPLQIHEEMLLRLKILSGLRTDEHQLPQDGRIRFSFTDNDKSDDIDIRVSIAPTYYGENAVLRLLSSRAELSSLPSLGLSAEHQTAIHHAISRPHGLILITGPTGSGKTSTLYALMQLLNKRDRSLITIEDPIEYSLDDVNQIQANRHVGLTFAEGLRSILRQDPNVIGIGEIRDHETAALAIHAALTGHLVISTLHTTDAPSALTRLIDMGIEPYLVASTVSLILGQRLARRLCPICRIKQDLTSAQESLISQMIPG